MSWLDGLDELSAIELGSSSSKLWLPAPDPALLHRSATSVEGPVGRVAEDDESRGASRWATQELGSSHRLEIPAGAWLVGIEVRTAPHQGIVDLRLRYSAADGSGAFTPWALGVGQGRVHELSCGGVPYAMGVTARYQSRAGIVNLRVLRAGGSGTSWAVPGVGGELHWAGLRAGAKLTGLEVRAQPGYGIVNLRALTSGV